MRFVTYLGIGLILGLGVANIVGFGRGSDPADRVPPSDTVKVRVINAEGKLSDAVTMKPVIRSEADWKKQLDGQAYDIIRRAGTERAGTGALLKNKKEGVYTCAACQLPLFASDAKFESGTGWPSWYAPIARENIDEMIDQTHGMRRTEINCARCAGHLGHVFNDGPAPTGLRYCVNSASVGFTPLAEVATLAETIPMNDPATSQPANLASMVIAGGCFWCVEAVFEELEGVVDAVSGYAGDTEETANYDAVCSGKTKHAEAVRIDYDPTVISYEQLLEVHFATHDPTQLNRQGNDIGRHYRSAIFFQSEEEKALAEAFIADVTEQKVFKTPIVTTLEPLDSFFEAERYHQNYVCANPRQGYVVGVALPKVEKVRKAFKDRLKAKSPLDQ